MGTLTPVLGTLTKTLGALETISSTVDTFSGRDEKIYRARQDQAMRQLQQNQAQSMQETQAKAESQRQELAIKAEEESKRRRNALRRAVARQNVKRGAGGISTSGSNEAILLGLYNDAEEDKSYASALDSLRYNSIDQNLSNLQSRNILSRTQLAEKQRLDRAIRNY